MPDASHFPIQDDEPLVIESVTALDGTPVPPASTRRAPGAVQWAATRLTVPGAVALVGGLVTLWCFLLPWFVEPVGAFGNDPTPRPVGDGPPTIPLETRAGWDIATGLLLNGPQGVVRAAFFIHLWLIPLAAAALLGVAWYAAQRRMSGRLAAGCVLALAVLALLVELGYALQVATLARATSISIGVAWGAWLALVVSLALGVVAINLLRPDSASLQATIGGAVSP